MSTYSNTEVIEERGEYRAIIESDESPSEPENDHGCPILRVEPSGYGGGLVSFTGYGAESYRHDGTKGVAIDALQQFVSNHGWSDGIDIFGRWLRIFHGGDAERWSNRGWDDPTYVAYTTEAMAQVWGYTPPIDAAILTPELSEWQAYCEGDVYFVTIQRRVLRRTEYVTLDDSHHPIDAHEGEVWLDVEGPVSGYYGEEHAREEVLSMLDGFALKVCSHCGTPLVVEDCPNYGTGEVHA